MPFGQAIILASQQMLLVIGGVGVACWLFNRLHRRPRRRSRTVMDHQGSPEEDRISPMNIIDWLECKAPGFRDLSEDERNAIMEFSLLWSLFEAKVLNTHGNATAIVEATEQWATKGLLIDGAFKQQLSYFQSRYYADGAFTDRYRHLKLGQVRQT